MEAVGIRYGLTTYALTSSTTATATAIVTIQSIVSLKGRGRRPVKRSIGFLRAVRPRLVDRAAYRSLRDPLVHGKA